MAAQGLERALTLDSMVEKGEGKEAIDLAMVARREMARGGQARAAAPWRPLSPGERERREGRREGNRGRVRLRVVSRAGPVCGVLVDRISSVRTRSNGQRACVHFCQI